MPQPQQSETNLRHPRLPIQIAQGGEETHGQTTHRADTPAGGEHAGTTHAGTEHVAKPGDIPNPWLLLQNSILVAALMLTFAVVARKKLAIVPRGISNFGELIAESLNNLTVNIIGHGGEKYTPLVGTLFIYIFLMNLIGQVPGFHSPTANISITLALGATVFFYVQMQGIKNLGLKNYVGHFFGPMPWEGLMFGIKPFLFFIELVSELIKPFTLAIRLFGNIFGEDVILLVLAGLSLEMLSFPGLPLQFPLILLALLTSFVQAMVFSMLTAIYLSLMSHHDDEHGEDHEKEGAHGAAHVPAAAH
jgi:F-type H+-transporting ATPase subunit a